MKKTALITFLFLFFCFGGFCTSENHKFEYGITPAAIMFPVGSNFAGNFEPSIGLGLFAFYNITDFLSVGVDGNYTFHFVNKNASTTKISLIQVSPSIKLQKYFGKISGYVLFGYGLYNSTLMPDSKSLAVGGFNGKIGLMYKTAPNWKLGISTNYHYVNSIMGIKPARYITSAIEASVSI